jgi:hypothetical protein
MLAWIWIIVQTSLEAHFEQLEMRCMPMLTQIDLLQQERDEKMDKQQAFTQLLRDQKISVDQHQKHLELWIVQERELHKEVDTLFNQAEAEGCL